MRVDVSSSNYPESDVNPNTGVAHVGGGRTMVTDNMIYHDTANPSRILFPVIP